MISNPLATTPPDSPTASLRGAEALPQTDPRPHEHTDRTRSNRTRLILLVVVITAFLAWGARSWIVAGQGQSVQITAKVTRSTLTVNILAGGELRSSNKVDVFCEVEGKQTKIIEMLPEGTLVTEGQIIVSLDPSEVHQRLARQEITVMKVQAAAQLAREEMKIQKNIAAGRIAQAQLAVTLTELDRRKYLEGDYAVEEMDLRGSIALAETELQEAKDALEHFRELVKKGFRTPEQRRAKEQDVMRAQYNLDRDREKLRVLENFTHQRQLVELTARVTQAKREAERAASSSEATIAQAKTDWEAALGTARLETQQLEKLQQQLSLCDVRAPIAGTLVYVKKHGQNQIELGSTVHYKQELFSLPDMTQMQVRAFVDESVVKKVKPEMPAEIRIEAYPHLVLSGTVQSVATFYDRGRHWWSGGVKQYVTVVKIDDLPDVDLKPGMTAEVNILAAELSDVLIVPLQAVTQIEDRYYSYVVQSGGVVKRAVSIGENNENFVQILDGLNENEWVALDARAQAAADTQNTQTTGVINGKG